MPPTTPPTIAPMGVDCDDDPGDDPAPVALSLGLPDTGLVDGGELGLEEVWEAEGRGVDSSNIRGSCSSISPFSRKT